MYEHSRDLFTALRPLLREPEAPTAKRQLLRSCEAAVQHLAHGEAPDRLSDRTFREVRSLLALHRALDALQMMERRLEVLHRAMAEARVAPLQRCAATNRRGEPCGRDALRGTDYCHSHRHLAGALAPVAPDAVVLLRRPPEHADR